MERICSFYMYMYKKKEKKKKKKKDTFFHIICILFYSENNVLPPCGLIRDCSHTPDGSYADKELNCTSYFTCSHHVYFGHNYCTPGTEREREKMKKNEICLDTFHQMSNEHYTLYMYQVLCQRCFHYFQKTGSSSRNFSAVKTFQMCNLPNFKFYLSKLITNFDAVFIFNNIKMQRKQPQN